MPSNVPATSLPTLLVHALLLTTAFAATIPTHQKPNRHLHKVLNARDESIRASNAASVLPPPFTGPNPNKKGKGFWKDLGDLVEKYHILDFLSNLFGGQEEGDGEEIGTTTIIVRPTSVAGNSSSLVTSFVTSAIPATTTVSTSTSDASGFHILSYILPSENISDNVTYPTSTPYITTPEEPVVVITVADDFPNEPTTTPTPTIPIAYTAYTPPSSSGVENVDSNDSNQPISSILPWILPGANLTDNVTSDGDFFDEPAAPTTTPIDESTPPWLGWNGTGTGAYIASGMLIYTNPLRPTVTPIIYDSAPTQEEANATQTISTTTTTSTTRFVFVTVFPSPIDTPSQNTSSSSASPSVSPSPTASDSSPSAILIPFPYYTNLSTPSPFLPSAENPSYTAKTLQNLQNLCTSEQREQQSKPHSPLLISLPLLTPSQEKGERSFFPGCIPLPYSSQSATSPTTSPTLFPNQNCTPLIPVLQTCRNTKILLSIPASFILSHASSPLAAEWLAKRIFSTNPFTPPPLWTTTGTGTVVYGPGRNDGADLLDGFDIRIPRGLERGSKDGDVVWGFVGWLRVLEVGMEGGQAYAGEGKGRVEKIVLVGWED